VNRGAGAAAAEFGAPYGARFGQMALHALSSPAKVIKIVSNIVSQSYDKYNFFLGKTTSLRFEKIVSL
jgi:hypothetical protein